jgi:raffinose/stachyose/melibiose transport system permease protein
MIKKRFKDELILQLLFIGPAVIFFIIVVLIPFFMGIYYSMTTWNGISDDIKWVGIKNFKRLINDENFLKAFLFTVKFTVTNIILSNVVAFILAIILTRPLKIRNILRAIFFIPNVISGLLLGFIWQFIFVKGFGTIGELTKIPLFQLPWLGDSKTGFWATVIVSVWQFSGYLMVIYVAGLANIPSDVMEAAHIDGANKFDLLKKIIIPMIMPSITVCLFLSISSSFKMFDLNFALTSGNFNTSSIALDIYNEAFTSSNYGLGSAKALVFFIVVALITSTQVWLTKRKEVQI